ncbi:MAG: hypothetical protein GC165_07545 [Armatimonadetes bacterium]|nr:hypothetical protein [Armatimonadota bacterium]
MANDGRYESIRATISKELGRLVSLSKEDLEDLASACLLEYYKYSTSGNPAHLQLAERIALEQGLRQGWLRNRVNSFLRARYRRKELADIVSMEDILSDIPDQHGLVLLGESDLTVAIQEIVRKLDAKYQDVFEVMLNSAMTGRPEKYWAEKRGFKPSRFSQLKRELLKIIRERLAS